LRLFAATGLVDWVRLGGHVARLSFAIKLMAQCRFRQGSRLGFVLPAHQSCGGSSVRAQQVNARTGAGPVDVVVNARNIDGKRPKEGKMMEVKSTAMAGVTPRAT